MSMIDPECGSMILVPYWPLELLSSFISALHLIFTFGVVTQFHVIANDVVSKWESQMLNWWLEGDICVTPLIHSLRLQEQVSKSNGGEILKDDGLVDTDSYPEFEMNAVSINPSQLSAASPRR